jgi:hypothetical protein
MGNVIDPAELLGTFWVDATNRLRDPRPSAAARDSTEGTPAPSMFRGR